RERRVRPDRHQVTVGEVCEFLDPVCQRKAGCTEHVDTADDESLDDRLEDGFPKDRPQQRDCPDQGDDREGPPWNRESDSAGVGEGPGSWGRGPPHHPVSHRLGRYKLSSPTEGGAK